MSTDFLTHPGRRSVQLFSDGAHALARSKATGDLFALNKAQHPRRTLPYGGGDTSGGLEHTANRRTATTQCSSYRKNGLSDLVHAPKLGALGLSK